MVTSGVDVVLRDMVWWAILAMGGWLDKMILEVFFNLNDSVIGLVTMISQSCYPSA